MGRATRRGTASRRHPVRRSRRWRRERSRRRRRTTTTGRPAWCEASSQYLPDDEPPREGGDDDGALDGGLHVRRHVEQAEDDAGQSQGYRANGGAPGDGLSPEERAAAEDDRSNSHQRVAGRSGDVPAADLTGQGEPGEDAEDRGEPVGPETYRQWRGSAASEGDGVAAQRAQIDPERRALRHEPHHGGGQD